MTKIIIGILGAVVLIGGGIWYVNKDHTDENGNMVESSSVSASLKSREETKNSVQGSSSVTSQSPVENDLASIDSHMKSMDDDSKNVDESMNDKPISQE